MQELDPIQVLGRGSDVQFTIDDTVPFDVAERSLREYLDVCRGLYSKGTVSVNVGRRILFPDQLSVIKGILAQETGLTVTEYWCPPETLRRAQAGPDLPIGLTRTSPPVEAVVTVDVAAPEDCIVSEAPQTPGPAPREAASAAESPPAVDPGEAQQLSLLFPDLDLRAESTAQHGPAPQLPAASVEDGSDQPPSSSAVIQIPGNEAVGEPGPAMEPGVADGADAETATGTDWEDLPTSSAPVPDVAATEEAGRPADAETAGFATLGRGDEALIIKTTCRSGEIIRYPGDVVVFGDVNPGAEIIAGGDVIVLGTLRGMAHAGADGNPKATIFALNLEAHRLQIGSHFGEAPRGRKPARPGSRPAGPRIAYLRRRSIFVAPFVRRCEEYQGGILYEG